MLLFYFAVNSTMIIIIRTEIKINKAFKIHYSTHSGASEYEEVTAILQNNYIIRIYKIYWEYI